MNSYFKGLLFLFLLMNVNDYKVWSQSSGISDNVYRLIEMTDSFPRGSKNKPVVFYRHLFTYDRQGRPVSHTWNYSYKGKLISSNKLVYNYDETNGRLLSIVSDKNRYHYFYNSDGGLQRITLDIFSGNKLSPQWILYEETLLEQTELSGNKRSLLLTMNKRRVSGPRKDSMDNFSKIEYTVGADNNIIQSSVKTYNYNNLKVPLLYTYGYDTKPNPLQQIFVQRWFEFDLENKGLTNLSSKKSGDKITDSRVYEYNESGYPAKCVINGIRTLCFKYERLEVPVLRSADSPEVVHQSSLLLFPNPATTEVTVRADGLGKGTAHLRLYDLNGRVHKEVNYTVSNTLEVLIPVGGLPKGMYIIEITTSKTKMTQKLILQ
jgi:hypothetical protein